MEIYDITCGLSHLECILLERKMVVCGSVVESSNIKIFTPALLTNFLFSFIHAFVAQFAFRGSTKFPENRY